MNEELTLDVSSLTARLDHMVPDSRGVRNENEEVGEEGIDLELVQGLTSRLDHMVPDSRD